MWGYYYSQIARKPTTSAASPPPPTSPTFSASTESPPNTFTPANSSFPDPHPTSPHTPINQDSLQRIEDTGGSRAPLVARDFAHQSEGEGSSSRSIRLHQASQFPSIPTLTSPPSPKSKPIDPLLIPPPSVHDAYLSNLIVPLNPDRPPIVRANSAPGSGAPHTSLLPSAIPGTASDEGKPIFEIFNAELNTPAEEMVKVLKEHLEGVLKMQEEIGRMHLGLEKLDLTGEVPEEENVEVDGADGLGKREKAVDDIMERLGTLSDRLRTYHHLGTPKLSFPQANPQSQLSARNKPRTQSVDPAILAASTSPRSPPLKAKSPPPASTQKNDVPVFRSESSQATSRSPPAMKGLASRVDADGEARRQGGRSTLSPVRDDWPGTPTSPDMSGQRGSGRGTVDVNEQSLRGLVLEGGVLGRGEARAGWSDSPLEMTDRSRPW